MTGGLFLDTSGWFTAIAPSERGHERARAAYDAAITTARSLVTTNLVLAEMQVLMLRWRGPRAASAFLDAVFEHSGHRVVYTDQKLTADAITRWIRPYADQSFSLTDAVSFEVMRRERLTEALALDRNFMVTGYRLA